MSSTTKIMLAFRGGRLWTQSVSRLIIHYSALLVNILSRPNFSLTSSFAAYQNAIYLARYRFRFSCEDSNENWIVRNLKRRSFSLAKNRKNWIIFLSRDIYIQTNVFSENCLYSIENCIFSVSYYFFTYQDIAILFFEMSGPNGVLFRYQNIDFLSLIFRFTKC